MASTEQQPRYEQLRVWQEAMELTREIYKLSSSFPKEELYGITSQLRRAALSIPLNIAEGQSRGATDFRRFLTISLGSCNETLTILTLSKDLQMVAPSKVEMLRAKLLSLMKQLRALSIVLQKQSSKS